MKELEFNCPPPCIHGFIGGCDKCRIIELEQVASPNADWFDNLVKDLSEVLQCDRNASSIIDAAKDYKRRAAIGKLWEEDSSLEKWFPITAENIPVLERKAKALDSIERLCDKTPLAIWKGEWADNDQNIRLGRVGAPIVTVCTMDADGGESNADDIGEGGSVLEAIEQAMRKEKV